MNDDLTDTDRSCADRADGNGDRAGTDDWMDWFDRRFGPPDAGDAVDLPAPAELSAPAPAALPASQPDDNGDVDVDVDVDGDGDGGTASGLDDDVDGSDAWAFLDEPGEGDDDATPELVAAAPRRRSLPVRVLARIFRRPIGWIRRPWPMTRIVQLALTSCSLIVTTWVMFRVVHFNPFEWAGFGGKDLVFDPTTPSGGDLGAHVWAPAYLRDELLPNWQLNGWSMDWYAGLPVYRFYMVVPALAVVLLDTFLAYGVAMKVVAMLGMVTLPWCCWAFGRLARFRYPVPELFAFAGLCFVLNESYYLLGGNVRSTMAGEFSFSIAVSLMMLGLGLLCRGLDRAADGAWRSDTRRVLVWAAVLLALACLSHGIVLIYTLVTASIIVVCRCGADLWRVLRDAASNERVARWLVIGIVVSPAVLGLTVLAAQLWPTAYYLTALVALAAVLAIAVLCVQLGATATRRLFADRLLVAMLIGGLTLLLSAFWVGPFLFNHQYMTDMKYQAEPSNMYRDFWEMIFDQKLPLDILINALAGVGLLFAVARRQVYGIAVGITMFVAIALVFLTRDSLPAIGLLWNPRVLPFVYLMRYLLMMMGAVEVVGLSVRIVANRPARNETGFAAGSSALVLGGLAVLVIFGWVFKELPGASEVTVGGKTVYSWGPFTAPPGQNGDALGDGWTSYNFNGYERRHPYPEYYDLVQTMDGLGEELGCGRAMWERDQRDQLGNERYGSSMALMLLPFWTDGCIASSEGLYFEASGTTPYHFITSGAISESANSPVRQTRNQLNDGELGALYLQTLGIKYLMVTRPAAIAEADAQTETLRLVDTSGPWNIYEVIDSAVVEPMTVQPVVVNPREGDQRECWLEVGESWFQNRDEWAATPADDGPAEWQRIDVRIDETRQKPEGQGTDGCGDPQYSPSRQVNVVVPDDEIVPVDLPAIDVTNVDIQQQSVDFDVSQTGVPVLVRVSYFPNWQVSGADGPYRIAPNFMVVVPTSSHVRLEYGRTTMDYVFDGATLVGIVAAFSIRLGWPRRRRRERTE